MTQESPEAAAAARVAGGRAAATLTELHARMKPCFARPGPFAQARKYMAGLISDLPRKNGWTIAEHAGDATPDRTQRLLNHAVWDTDAVAGLVRKFVVEHLRGGVQDGDDGADLAVGALDESGHQKQGIATAGVTRQYMGCAGRVANGVNTVYCTFATPGGHSLVGARIWVPADQLQDPDRRAAVGIPDEVEFTTKPLLAQAIIADMAADQTLPPWFAGDEVYGRSRQLRDYIEQQGAGYVMRVGCDFRVQATPHTRERLDHLVATHLTDRNQWETRSVPGSKGARAYAWAWLDTADKTHHILIRKHLSSGDMAYHYCYVPPGRPVTLTTLIRVACLRWPVEETFEFGKDHFGLDHCQVRLYTAMLRHIVLTMAALAVCAITAAAEKPRRPPILPNHPDQPPPRDTGLIAFTVAEIKRLFTLLNPVNHDAAHHLHWVIWRQRHQARARWFHHRTRLRRDHPQ